MAQRGKINVAKICFAVAVVFFILGFFIMCACPGWYVMASIFAGIAIWRSSARLRKWSWICLIACVAMTASEFYGMLVEKKHFRERIDRLNAMQHATNLLTTNSPAKPTAP